MRLMQICGVTDDFWDKWDLLKICSTAVNSGRTMWQRMYPDCDMLPLGWLGKGFGHEWYTNFTPEEQHTMLTLWCLFGSPLMLGCELTKLDDATLALTNRDVLSMLTPDCKPHQVCLDDEKAIWCAYNAVTGEHLPPSSTYRMRHRRSIVTSKLSMSAMNPVPMRCQPDGTLEQRKNIRIRQCHFCHTASTRMSGISCKKTESLML